MALIVGGKEVPCDVPVHNWTEHGMKFSVGKGGRARKKKVKNITLHWTAGEGDGKKVYMVLNSRKLGIGFHIDPKGVVTQFSDPLEVATFGQGVINDFSEGIEMSNYAFGKVQDSHRPIHEQILKGHKIKVADFYDAQMHSMVALVTALCNALDIPKVIPGKDGKFLAEGLTMPQMNEYAGVNGHINIPGTTKVDPGLQPFDVLLKNGFTIKEIK